MLCLFMKFHVLQFTGHGPYWNLALRTSSSTSNTIRGHVLLLPFGAQPADVRARTTVHCTHASQLPSFVLSAGIRHFGVLQAISDWAKSRTLQEQRRFLPVYDCRDELLQVIRENQVVVVVGETGSGKTTQVQCQGIACMHIMTSKMVAAKIWTVYACCF